MHVPVSILPAAARGYPACGAPRRLTGRLQVSKLLLSLLCCLIVPDLMAALCKEQGLFLAQDGQAAHCFVACPVLRLPVLTAGDMLLGQSGAKQSIQHAGDLMHCTGNMCCHSNVLLFKSVNAVHRIFLGNSGNAGQQL